jgi:hypothetical protein
MNSYELSRNWFDWCFENPEKINPNHSALYFFCIEHCNRLGWKEKFGLPTTMAKEAIGIKSYNTYSNTLNDLVQFGFIKMLERSKNQYSANIIALSKFNKALDKALDKALIKHTTKQSESTRQSNSSIDKQITINNKQETNNIDSRKLKFSHTLKPYLEKYGKDLLNDFYLYWTEPNKSNTKFKQELQSTWSLERRLNTWIKNDKNFKPNGNTANTIRETPEQKQLRIFQRVLGADKQQTFSQSNTNTEDTNFVNVP